MAKIVHVLLTGGVGSRLWPLSRKSRPKQYLPLFKGNSLFELAVKRNKPFTDDLIVVGNRENIEFSENSLSRLSQKYDDIVEAIPRNTAPAIAFAAFKLEPSDILLVTPADHIIEKDQKYRQAVEQAIALAKKDHIVTFGIKPTYPETGFGYIEHKKTEVLAFHEKPEKERAEEYVKKGGFLWNSGIFCFKAGVFLNELKRYAPEVYSKSLVAWQKNRNGFLDKESTLEIPAISADYAVMEKSAKIKVIASSFDWNDMGSFESLYTYLKKQGHPIDDQGNMTVSMNKQQNPSFFVGLSNCILVVMDDVTLVLQKEAAQQVKTLYKTLEERKSSLLN